MSAEAARPVPVVSYFRPDPAGPAIVATVCDRCSAVYLARRNGCGRCGGSKFSTREYRGPGTVLAYTTVYRDAPSVAVPFVSVLVDFGDGLMVKGNLTGIDPEAVERHVLGHQVDLVTRSLPPDRHDRTAVSFSFELSVPAVDSNQEGRP